MHENMIKTALENAGVYVQENDFSMKLTIRDLIEDSLSFISFFVEIESLFDIEIPDEFYNRDVFGYTLEQFLHDVILPCKS